MVGRLAASTPYFIVLALAGAFYYVATTIATPQSADQLGPDFWPKLVLILMMVSCACGIARALLFGARRAVDATEGLVDQAAGPASGIEAIDGAATADGSVAMAGGSDAAAPPRYPLLLVAGAVISIAYVALFNVLGFFIDTFLLLFAFIVIGRYRRIGIALIVALLGTLTFMFVFMKIVYVPLPLGTAPFSEVSIALMKLMGIR
jgi:putative tricarboxylic transport membrane protein